MKPAVWIAAVGLFVMAAAGAVSGFADDAAVPAADASAAVKHQALCPVMGGVVNTNLYADAAGKRIYVCCKMCLPAVKKDSAKYIQKMEAEGITLETTPKADGTNTPAVTP